MPLRLAHRAGLLLAGLALAGVTGCSGGGDGQAADLHVTERDFHISAPKVVRAGDLSVAVRNNGPDDHEFIVVRLHGNGLPLRNDGLTVNEDAIESSTAGAVEPAPPGVEHLSLRLKPGRYELLCNMYGHFAGGMHRTLVVRS
ncbi:MAG TPA: hypothetical protein VHR40_01360 [Thermoleophilaceae bacterium]|jgi:uncharacterized cupredoxin-like copper-binding protein|nr:hypothetical protein [Thermoleophilaceae bacterium]